MGTNTYVRKPFKTRPFKGYRMGTKEFMGKMVVAIPKKRLIEAKNSGRRLMVMERNDPTMSFMEFTGREIPLALMECEDKFGRRDNYYLYYYIWNPKRQLGLFND